MNDKYYDQNGWMNNADANVFFPCCFHFRWKGNNEERTRERRVFLLCVFTFRTTNAIDNRTLNIMFISTFLKRPITVSCSFLLLPYLVTKPSFIPRSEWHQGWHNYQNGRHPDLLMLISSKSQPHLLTYVWKLHTPFI